MNQALLAETILNVITLAKLGLNLTEITNQVESMEKEGKSLQEIHAWTKAKAKEGFDNLRTQLNL